MYLSRSDHGLLSRRPEFCYMARSGSLQLEPTEVANAVAAANKRKPITTPAKSPEQVEAEAKSTSPIHQTMPERRRNSWPDMNYSVASTEARHFSGCSRMPLGTLSAWPIAYRSGSRSSTLHSVSTNVSSASTR